MKDLLFRGARVVDPSSNLDRQVDLLVRDGAIAAIGKDATDKGAEVIDCDGAVLAPGLVDMHTHLREPGREDEETIASGSIAAAAGGYTAVCAMPNTDPVADTSSVVEKVWALGREAGVVQVVPAGALSRGLEGVEMADIGEMARSIAKVRLFTDDGHGVQDALFVRRTMEYLLAFDGIYAEHCEDASLAAGGQMNEGDLSVSLGLRGIPSEAEELMAARDIALSRLTGCPLHLLHVSTAGTVELVRRSKADGLRVTAEATPHHFSLTEEVLRDYDPNAKVNPPLRSETDRQAIIKGLADGTIDAIATDHAPHADHEKDQEITYAPPGMIGLETALALTVTNLVEPGHIALADAVALLSTRPARILGLQGQGGPLEVGAPANLCVFDPGALWTVDSATMYSQSRNTPFHGTKVRGKVLHTIYMGRITVRDSRPVEGALI